MWSRGRRRAATDTQGQSIDLLVSNGRIDGRHGADQCEGPDPIAGLGLLDGEGGDSEAAFKSRSGIEELEHQVTSLTERLAMEVKAYWFEVESQG